MPLETAACPEKSVWMQIIDIMERPSRRHDLREWYAAILEDQESSGVSVAEYADSVGVSAATLYQWRRRQSSADRITESESDTAPSLIELTLCKEPRAAHRTSEDAARFIIQLSGGRRVEVPSRFNSAELRRLIVTVESC